MYLQDQNIIFTGQGLEKDLKLSIHVETFDPQMYKNKSTSQPCIKKAEC